MKKYTIFFLILFQTITYCQNWQLINPNYQYHYCSDNNEIPDYSLKVDSININKTDTIFYFNKVISDCKSCANPGTIYANMPNIFDYACMKTNDYCSFYPRKNFVIYPNLPVDSVWVLDTARSTTAQISRIEDVTTFGIPDSIKIIKLSSGDSIVISKNYGITKFFDPDSNKYYNLTGAKIYNEKFGTVPPDFNSIYNFDVGDIFCYYKDYYSAIGDRPTRDYSRYKIEILSKHIKDSSVIYQQKETGYSYKDFYWIPEGEGSTSYFSYQREVIYTDMKSDPSNLLKHELCFFNEQENSYFLVTDIIYDANDERIIKRIGNEIGQIIPSRMIPKHLYRDYVKTYNPVYIVPDYGLDYFVIGYKEGVGLIDRSYDDFEIGELEILVGYKKGNVTYGKVYEEWELTGINDEKVSNDFFVYPTLMESELNINAENTTDYTIQIFNVLGELVFEKLDCISGTTNILLDKLFKGTYVIRLSNNREILFSKVLIKK